MREFNAAHVTEAERPLKARPTSSALEKGGAQFANSRREERKLVAVRPREAVAS